MKTFTCHYCGKEFESDYSHEEIQEAAEEKYPEDDIEIRDMCLDCYEGMTETKH